MFVEMKTINVQIGFADLVVNRFSEAGKIEQAEGFLDLQVLVNKRNKLEQEEVIITIRWHSEQAYKNWKKSPQHVAGHKVRTEKPAYILSSKSETYVVKSVKMPAVV